MDDLLGARRGAWQSSVSETLAAPVTGIDTELSNALRLVRGHGEGLRYCRAWRRWLFWDGKRWVRDDTGEIERRAADTVRSIYSEAGDAPDADTRVRLARWATKSESRTVIKNMIELASFQAEVAIAPAQLDADAWLLNVSNGILDLRTGVLGPHDPAKLMTKLAPVDYDPAAEAPTWSAFLGRILPSVDLRVFLQRAIGYSLTGDTSEQVLLLAHGGGANGKTTMFEITQSALGDYALRADFATFLARDRADGGARSDLARLAGARFVSAVEIEAGRRFSEVVIKEVTGGDTITARYLYSEFFDFQPTFKLWFAANHKPVIRGTDQGIWRRIRLLPFTVTIPTDEQDHSLPEKLRGELPGILAWAVRGCLDWQAHGLGAPEEVMTATAAYREEMDPLGSFLEECCTITDRGRVSAHDLYHAYLDHCQASGEHPIARKTFGMRLQERGFDRTRTATDRWWIGIGLSNDE